MMRPVTVWLMLLLGTASVPGQPSVSVTPDASARPTSTSTSAENQDTSTPSGPTAKLNSTAAAYTGPTTVSNGSSETQPASTVQTLLSTNASWANTDTTNLSTESLPVSSTWAANWNSTVSMETNSTVSVMSENVTTDVEMTTVTTGAEVTSSVENPGTSPALSCPDPGNFPYGSFSRNGTSITYSCYHGYQMQGEGVRHCQNGSWSSEQPVCVLTPSTKPEEEWISVFTYNVGWRGVYQHEDQNYQFTLQVTHVNRSRNTVTAQFLDDYTIVVLQGERLKNGTITFKASEVRRPNHRITDTHFTLQGELKVVNQSYRFTGFIKTASATYQFAMAPIPDDPSARMTNKAAQALIVALSVLLALCVLLALGLVLYQVMKRNGLLNSPRSHGTLTSFENPVYEFENSLNASLTGSR